MPKIHSLLVTDQDTGQRFVTVFVPGAKVEATDDSHPNFEAILEAAANGDPNVLDLFDVADTVAKRFEYLTDRVAVANGRIYLDGDEIDNSLTQQVVRFLNEDVDDWEPLVLFFENVQANPSEHSREQLYTWLADRDFTITSDGNFIAYKGVRKTSDGRYESINRGPGIVNGEAVNGALDNAPGNTVEIARSTVVHDPNNGCAFGLHVGTYGYAHGWAQGATLKVVVNPRDVVSVPTDCDAQKVRVCRYHVLDVTDTPVSAPYYDEDYYDDDWDYDDWDYDDDE